MSGVDPAGRSTGQIVVELLYELLTELRTIYRLEDFDQRAAAVEKVTNGVYEAIGQVRDAGVS